MSALKSNVGDWVFYNSSALQVAITAHVMCNMSASPPTKQNENCLEQTPVDTQPSLVPDARASLLDGVSIEQWANYAKRKAHIASAVCKENGVLKARLQDLARHHDVAADLVGDPHEASAHEDKIFQHDPWHMASS